MWAGRLVVSEVRKTEYQLHEFFDIAEYSIRFMTAGGALNPIPNNDNAIDVFYDFSEIGNTLVTISYNSGAGRLVRYIPVKVVSPEISTINLNAPPPIKSTFTVGEEFPFLKDTHGLSLILNYNNGEMEIITEDLIITPNDFTATAGEKELTVTHPEHPGITRTFNVNVENSVVMCDACGESPCECDEFKLGDVNGDGVIDIMDALEILKFLAGIENVISKAGNHLKAALIIKNDVRKEPNKSEIGDALEILKKLAGIENLIDTF